MKDYYKLTFPITSSARKTTQKLLLIGAIAVDIGNFFVLIDCIFGSLYYLFALFGLFIISTCMRIASLYCNYTYLYLFNGGEFLICKAYSLKTQTILTLKNNSDFSLKPHNNENKSFIKLYNLSCEFEKYDLIINGKTYAIALDAYMYALIDNRLKKEDNNDIS